MTVPDVEKLLADLVAIPSVNPGAEEICEAPYGEARVAEYVAEFWRGIGIDCQVQEVLPGRPNVIARLDLSNRPVLVLQTHMDTVAPAEEAEQPFTPRVDGGRMYGRGACDAKASLAAMMHAVARAARDAGEAKRAVVMAAAVDEEYQFRGAQAMIAGGVWGDEVVVGEPTLLNVVISHKGAMRWKISTAGRSAHSSEPEKGENAVYKMARIVLALEEHARELAGRPADSGMGPPTLCVGAIHGGDLPNVVPDWCYVLVDRRIVPGESFEQVEEQLRAAIERNARGVEYQLEAILRDPPLRAEGNQALAERVSRIARAVAGAGGICSVRYASDASKFAEAGMAAVLLGPGNVAQAHAKDEWIELEQVRLASEIYYRLIMEE